MVVKPNTTEVEHVAPSENKTPSLWNDDDSLADGFSPVASSSNGHHKNRTFSVTDSELNYDQSEESLASPGGRSAFESPFVSSPQLKDDLRYCVLGLHFKVIATYEEYFMVVIFLFSFFFIIFYFFLSFSVHKENEGHNQCLCQLFFQSWYCLTLDPPIYEVTLARVLPSISLK